MKKRKEMAMARRSLKKSGVAAKKGREGIYASTAPAHASKKFDDGLGLTLLPGSQIHEDAVNEESVIDPVVALRDGAELECLGPRRSSRLARQVDRNLSSCFTPTIQDRVLTLTQPPVIRTLLCSNTTSSSSPSNSSTTASTCTSSTIKLSSYNHVLALQALSNLSSQLASSGKTTPRSSKPSGVTKMDFTFSEDPPDDTGDFGSFFNQWSFESAYLYDAMDFGSVLGNGPATPENQHTTEARANIDDHQVTSTLANFTDQYTTVNDSDKARTDENTTSTVKINELVDGSTPSDIQYVMDTSTTSVTPATSGSPSISTTPATVCTPGTLDTPTTSNTEYIVLDNSIITLSQGNANPTIQAKESINTSTDLYTQTAYATPTSPRHQYSAFNDNEKTLTNGLANPNLRINESIDISTAFGKRYAIASRDNTYDEYNTSGDGNSTMTEGLPSRTTQSNESRQALAPFDDQYAAAKPANSYNHYTAAAGPNYTTVHGDGGSTYQADKRLISQMSVMPSNQLISNQNPGFAEHSVAVKPDKNDPALLLKLVRKQHDIVEHYKIEIEKYNTKIQKYKATHEHYKATNEWHKTELEQYKAEHEFLRAQNVDLDKQILEDKKRFATYKAQCDKLFNAWKGKLNTTTNHTHSRLSTATAAEDDVAKLRQIAGQATAYAGKAKDEIQRLKAERQTLIKANEQLKVSQDAIARLTKDRDNWKTMAEGWSRMTQTQPQVPSSSVKKVLAAYAPRTASFAPPESHSEQLRSNYAQNTQDDHAQHFHLNQGQLARPIHVQHLQSSHSQHVQPNCAQHMQPSQLQNTQLNHAQHIHFNHAQHVPFNHAQQVPLNHTQHVQIDLTQDDQPHQAQYGQPDHVRHAQHAQHAQYAQNNYIQPAVTAASNHAREKAKGWWLDPKAHGIVEETHPVLRKIDQKKAAATAKLQERAKKAKAPDKVTRAAQKAAAKQRMKESKARAAVVEVQKDIVEEEDDLSPAIQDDFGNAMDDAFAEMDAGYDSTHKEWTNEDDWRLMAALDADLANDEAKRAAAATAAADDADTEAAAVEADTGAGTVEAVVEDDDDRDSLFDE
ncbi:hypothetical protein MMC32_002147 [Xylographa parallela]|nr:hypothetical protein [Xylographa parallela]